MMVKPQGQVNHLNGFGNNLGPAAESCQEMTDVAVVLLYGKGQIPAREVLGLGDQPVESLPIVRDEGLALDPDLVEEPPAGLVITATTHPGEGAAGDRVICPPNPEFLSFFSRKCHISSSVMMTVPAVAAGSGS